MVNHFLVIGGVLPPFADTTQGAIRSLEATVQGFDERTGKLETDTADAYKRTEELETKVGASFEKEERYQQLSRPQREIEEPLDLTKNQAPGQVEADAASNLQQQTTETQTTAVDSRQRRGGVARV